MFSVRITARSARARLDGDLRAELHEAQLVKRVVTPYQNGLPIILGGRRLTADDIARVSIVSLGDSDEDVTDHYLGEGKLASESPASSESARRPAAEQATEIPSRLTVLVGVLTFGGVVITIAAAPAWAAAAAIAAALSTCMLHRFVWRPRPSTKGLLIVVAVTAASALSAYVLFEGGSEQRPARQVMVERTLLSPGVGQLEAGNVARASLSGASGTFSDPLLATIDSTVTVAIRLTNGGPDELIGTRVKASIPEGAASSLSVELVARPRNAHPTAVGDTATIDIKGGGSACLVYVPDSTRLFDQHLGLIRDLPDGITGDGVLIGTVGVPIEDRRFVGLELEMKEPQGGDCD